jgi:tRNA (uracil-5-)-methyltransferase
LFDVCCGTGTIGLTCLKEGVVGRVVGVDISAPAIEDAKINAALNGFGDESKVRFVASRAEHVLAQELKAAREGSSKHIIAVVDPARDGLHCEVIKALRQAEGIQRIVYVSCNPTGSLIKDAAIFCAPPTKKYGGRAFQPTSAQPVDMFPLTDHCELVVNFDRLNEDKLADP